MQPMDTATARQYLVTNGHRAELPEFDGWDGYEVMNTAKDSGWKARAAWGRDGWDLGSWPLVVYMFRDVDGSTFDLAEHVEGDIKVWRFPTDELRSALVDHLAFWWWQNEEQTWVAGLTIGAIPDHMRGPFSWARLDAEKVPA